MEDIAVSNRQMSPSLDSSLVVPEQKSWTPRALAGASTAQKNMTEKTRCRGVTRNAIAALQGGHDDVMLARATVKPWVGRHEVARSAGFSLWIKRSALVNRTEELGGVHEQESDKQRDARKPV
jgi:hypothetical protein